MAKPDKKDKNKKEKKVFFKDFKAELKKVNWPTAKQVVNNTTAVITIVLVTAIIVFVLDLAFELFNTYGINKLRNLVQTDTSTQQNVITESNNLIDENTVDANQTEEQTNVVDTSVEE